MITDPVYECARESDTREKTDARVCVCFCPVQRKKMVARKYVELGAASISVSEGACTQFVNVCFGYNMRGRSKLMWL